MVFKKRVLVITLLGILSLATLSTNTFAYFNDHQSVNNNVKISTGNLYTDFVSIDNKNISTPIISIDKLLPGKSCEYNFYIQNTGSLTNKIELNMDNFKGDTDLLPYLNYTITMGSKVYSGTMNQPIQLKYVDNNQLPILIKNNEKVKVNMVISLKDNAPYSTQGKGINFSINIIATQPNDVNWLASN